MILARFFHHHNRPVLLSFGRKSLLMINSQDFIQQYQLQPHPEGGWYKETYRSTEAVLPNALPARFTGERNFYTAIYFLLEAGNFSAFHKIKSDECWHFYSGQALLIYVIDPAGSLAIIRLGNDISRGEIFQYVVPANYWFASKPAPESNFCFVGCTVSPGFDFADFEMAEERSLVKTYPQHEAIIKKLCR
jgi:predicted cupin superfamily sugar epimerase